MKKVNYLTLALLFVISVSCREEDTANRENASQSVTSDALLSWEGEYEVDGCGFFITVDDKTYKPENEEFINDSFKVSSLAGTEVTITYQQLDTAIEKYCGDLPTPTTTPGIKLLSLERKN